jgi:hypothetical protein
VAAALACRWAESKAGKSRPAAAALARRTAAAGARRGAVSGALRSPHPPSIATHAWRRCSQRYAAPTRGSTGAAADAVCDKERCYGKLRGWEGKKGVKTARKRGPSDRSSMPLQRAAFIAHAVV